MKKKLRFSGILLHPTSLYGSYGIGDLGQVAKDFILMLEQSGVGLWQILPLTPVGYGASPYAAQSAFAGNELLISIDELINDLLLRHEDISTIPHFSDSIVEFDKVASFKKPLLSLAVSRFIAIGDKKIQKEYHEFLTTHSYWIEDYALYKALSDYYNDTRWYSKWEEGLKHRDEKTLLLWKKKLAKEIEEQKILQFFFFRQWQRIHNFAKEHQVAIVGDIPIFVAHDSADAWSHRSYLKMDDEGKLEKIAGVPPDAFSPTGQLWGNPVYNWEALKKDNYSWWIKRVSHQLLLTDMVRMDHFRGFEAAWEVPFGDTTAENGKWVKAPGIDFFNVLRKEIGYLPIIAEDLGVITKEVEELRDSNNFPGMNILQFAFNVDEQGNLDAHHSYLPHNWDALCASYTGTHDNNTTKGWYDALQERERDAVRRYLSCGDESVIWYFIRAVMASSAMYAIVPFQDILELDGSARMNFPGTCGGTNWAYKVAPGSFNKSIKDKIKAMVAPFGRDGRYKDLIKAVAD
ncbi:MAG: 4-alpha-glucanotransferase [Spirochaetia bacterium]|nr:4-alpha-glucanotransferase [Spirochaetia bacterium]